MSTTRRTVSKTRASLLRGTRAPALRGVARDAPSRKEAAAPLHLTLRLRSRSAGLGSALAAVLDGRRAPLSREEVAERFGADDADRVAVLRWAAKSRLEVVASDPARRVIELRAPAARLARLFSVTL